MEIYNFYKLITMFLFLAIEKSGSGNLSQQFLEARVVPLYGCIGGLLLFAVVFVLQGVGIAKMAKNRGLEKRWLAFVPFANIWYLGKLAGDGQFFGQRMKNTGLYAMIGQIVATIVTWAMIISETYLFYEHGIPNVVNDSYCWTGLTGFALAVEQFYTVSVYLVMIFQLICEVLLFILLTSLFKQYAPRNYSILSFLCLLVPLARFFTIFALRNRKAIDYEAYMRARREAFARRYQQTYNSNPYGNGQYGNPYGNPYGNLYGQNQSPYGQNGNATQKKAEDPFEEFSSDASKKTGGTSQGHSDENSDGFFD